MIFNGDSVTRDINQARTRAEELAGGLTVAQLKQRPQPDKWSIAECIAHLNVTAATVQGFMAKAIARGRQEKKFGSGPFSIGPKGRFLVCLAEPPPKIKIPAPRGVRPPVQIEDPLKLFSDFMTAQDEWERLMRECAGLDLTKIKVGPPASAFRARLAAALPWMMAHQRRHLLQAENAKRHIMGAGSSISAKA